MKLATSKWLAYTFTVGLMPMLMRLLAWSVTAPGLVEPVSAQDILAFGLILHVSIVNELEHERRSDKDWKTIQNGTTVLFVALYAALYAVSIVAEGMPGLIVSGYLLCVSAFLAATSALLCLATIHHLSK